MFGVCHAGVCNRFVLGMCGSVLVCVLALSVCLFMHVCPLCIMIHFCKIHYLRVVYMVVVCYE